MISTHANLQSNFLSYFQRQFINNVQAYEAIKKFTTIKN